MTGAGHPTNIIQLRKLLEEKLPHVMQREASRKRLHSQVHATGVSPLDNILSGGLFASQITELVGNGNGTGLLLRAVLRGFHEQKKWVALVDGEDCFDPGSIGSPTSPRLLWLRCRDAMQAVKAADLLLRDGNVPVLILDLFLHRVPSLFKIPSSTWHRFQRLVEQSAVALLVITPTRLVTPAWRVVALKGTFTLENMGQSEADLLLQLRLRLVRERVRGPLKENEHLAKAG